MPYTTWKSRLTLRPYTQSHTSNGVAGSGASIGLSTSSNTSLRDPSRFWKGRALYSSRRSIIAAFSSPSVANCRSRSLAMTAVAIFPTPPSTLAFCLGFATPVGMMAHT